MRIHIFGASGSGTTTLGRAIAERLEIIQHDTDDFFWENTNPPFQRVRELGERQRMLMKAIERQAAWVLSGSLCGWGDFAIPYFRLAVYLWLPGNIRMARLKKRERERYGADIDQPCHPMYKSHVAFLEWAGAYDTGGMEMRSRKMHEEWIAQLPCPVIRIEGEQSVNDSLDIVQKRLKERDTG